MIRYILVLLNVISCSIIEGGVDNTTPCGSLATFGMCLSVSADVRVRSTGPAPVPRDRGPEQQCSLSGEEEECHRGTRCNTKHL